jgi:ethanolamine permease
LRFAGVSLVKWCGIRLIVALNAPHGLIHQLLLDLTMATLAGMYFGYWVNLLSGLTFYFLASLWFTFHRSKFVNTKAFLGASAGRWPRPRGY